MPIYLRQSTASQEIPLGYFVDSTDGNTEETGLTISNTDIKIWKTGATTLADKNSGGATHISNGIYYCVLDATDTDTIGPLVVFVHESGALSVRVECCVLDEAVYDWMFGTGTPTTGGAITVTSGRVNADITHIATAAVSTSSAQLGVNVVQISGDSTSADNLESYTDGTTPQPVNATQISGDATAADNAEAFFDGTGYAGTNNVIPTVTNLTNAPTNGDLTATMKASVETAADSAITNNVFLDSSFTSLSAALKGLTLETGTIGATGNDTTHVHLAGLTYGDDEINNHLLVIHDVSEDEYHSRWITDYVGATDLATVATLPFTPQNSTDEFWLTSIRQDVTGGSGLDAAGVRAAIGLASANLDTQLGDIDNFLDTEVAAILADTNELQTDLTNGGRLDLLIDAILEDTGTTLDDLVDNLEARLGTPSDLGSGATIAANLVDIEGQTDDIGAAGAGLTVLATQASVNTIDDFLDTEIAAIKAKTDNLPSDPADDSDIDSQLASISTKIDTVDDLLDTEVAAIKTVVDAVKAKTDSLTFTVAGQVDSNVQSINDVTITGDGVSPKFGV